MTKREYDKASGPSGGLVPDDEGPWRVDPRLGHDIKFSQGAERVLSEEDFNRLAGDAGDSLEALRAEAEAVRQRHRGWGLG